MEWFLNGAVVGGFRFSGKKPVPSSSRTGGGIMIKGGAWQFSPQGINTFKNVVSTVDANLKKRLLVILKSAVKKVNVGRR